MPSRIVGTNGSECHSASGPVGTTSVCPAKHTSGRALPRRPRVFFEEWDEPPISGILWVSQLVAIPFLLFNQVLFGLFHTVVVGRWLIWVAAIITLLSMIGLLFTGNYILKGIRAVLHGPFNMHWKDYHLEIERRELIAVAPLLVLMVAVLVHTFTLGMYTMELGVPPMAAVPKARCGWA